MARRFRAQIIKEDLNTKDANDFARNVYNSQEDVKLNWWELFSNYRMKRWKQELKDLCEKTSFSLNDVCDYIGLSYTGVPNFYRKLPKLRETYIGIGMAYKLPLKTINRWIKKYGGKKQLYIKDSINDLVWIYLINVNYEDSSTDYNYYQQFDECRISIRNLYVRMQEVIPTEDIATADMDNDVKKVIFDRKYIGLKEFVRKNKNAFYSAYAKPKGFLNSYIAQILRVKNENKTVGRRWTLNSLRGYLDDSMINYLTSGIKYVPKSKRTHISIALAVGMTIEDLDKYLDMMGYAPLDATCLDEGMLINILVKWEEDHPLQKRFKQKYFKGNVSAVLKKDEELKAVNEMLGLRRDLKEIYEDFLLMHPDSSGQMKKFPYMNE